MARLPYIDAAQAPEDIRDALQRLPVQLNVFKMMAHASTCFRPLMRLGTSILGQQKLDGKLRELAILRVARLSPAEYEWVQHVPIAKATGASNAQIAALQHDDIEADCFDARERLMLRFTTEVVRDVRASDAVLAQMQKLFSSQEIVELILAIGFYMTVARLLETTGVDLEPAAGTSVVEAALRNRR